MISAIVLDIEGTTSSLAYLRSHLFPYSRERIAEWLHRPEGAEVARQVRAAANLDSADLAEVAAVLRRWIDEDRKAAPLKRLQGLIWDAGFARGDLRSHVYDDVPTALAAWTGAGIDVYIYSSGSAVAQRAWFGHTQYGDLTGRISGYFDIESAGGKHDTSSYQAIAAAIGCPPSSIAFASDVLGELDAAAAAGLRTVAVCRPEAAAQPPHRHPQVESFDQLDLSGDAVQLAGKARSPAFAGS